MAILNSDNQYLAKGAKPLDAKSLVKTYAELLLPETWLVDGVSGAYNGMITAVWLNTADVSKNGIYFLHDSAVTTARGKPDVTKEANWHRLGGVETLPGLVDQLKALQDELDTVKEDIKELQDSATIVRNSKAEFDEVGLPGKIYVATEEAMTYVWYNNDYLPVGDGVGNVEIQVIHGGSANGNG